MIFVTEQELKAEIKQGKFQRVYFIYGEDNYLKNYYAEFIAKNAVMNLPDMNYIKLDGRRVDVVKITDEVEQLPCMSEYRCVLLNDFDYLAQKEKAQKDFRALIADIPPSTVLIILVDTFEINEKKPEKWGPVINACNKAGASICFDHKSVSQLQDMIIKACAKRKVMIDLSTAKHMIEVCGRETAKLQGEVNKLCSYKGEDGRITTDDVDKLCTKTVDANKYELSKRIISGNVPGTMQLISDLYDMRMKDIEINMLIIGGFVDIYRAKAFVSAGVSPSVAAEELNYGRRGFSLKYAAADAKKISQKTLRTILDILNDTDIALKSTAVDKRFLIEETVIRIMRLIHND